MTTFELSTGILKAKVVRYMQNYVVIAIEYEGLSETKYETIPNGNFNGLENWIDDTYDLIQILGY